MASEFVCSACEARGQIRKVGWACEPWRGSFLWYFACNFCRQVYSVVRAESYWEAYPWDGELTSPLRPWPETNSAELLLNEELAEALRQMANASAEITRNVAKWNENATLFLEALGRRVPRQEDLNLLTLTSESRLPC